MKMNLTLIPYKTSTLIGFTLIGSAAGVGIFLGLFELGNQQRKKFEASKQKKGGKKCC
jgi:hypothetical protein